MSRHILADYVPFLAWATHIASSQKAMSVESRGYKGEAWGRIDRIREAMTGLPQGFLIPMRVFQAGECPNDSRVYYSFLAHGAVDPKAGERIGNYLGEPSTMTHRKAGQLWDHQVEDTNRLVNAALPRNLQTVSVVASAPAMLVAFYSSRLPRLWNLVRGNSLAIEDLRMKVKQRLRKQSGIEVGEGEPDGFWLAKSLPIQAGGIFESKLTLPAGDLPARILAAYALLAEYQFKIDFDFGCFLSLDGDLRVPKLAVVPITEVSRQDALTNLERAVNLIGRALISRGRLGRARPWGSFLIRPEPPGRIPACSHCFFVERCNPREDS